MRDFTNTHAAIRHYSALRFAMLSVFTLITGGLLSAKYSTDFTGHDVHVCLWLIGNVHIFNLIGSWVAAVFLVFEVALNFYLCGLWKQLPTPDVIPIYRRGFIVWPVRLAAVSLPLGALLLWTKA